MMEAKPSVKFDDIVGLLEVKTSLIEAIVYPNHRPDIFQGIRAPPRGILLFGPPGNGKTLIAKAVANESGASFYNVSASALVAKFMGESERLMKALFQSAYANQPAIIFIDEIDSVLKSRSESEHEASRRIKTEFLVQFDGASSSDQDRIIVIGATNKPEEIDSAAIRRFVTNRAHNLISLILATSSQTKRILIDTPCKATRMQLLGSYSKGAIIQLTDLHLSNIADKTDGYSCSDIKALVKEACMNPLRKMKKDQLMSVVSSQIPPVTEKDFLDAIRAVPPSISKKELKYFKDLQKQYNKVV